MTSKFEIIDDEGADGRLLKTSLDSEGEDSSVAGVGSDDSGGGEVRGVGSEDKKRGGTDEGRRERRAKGSELGKVGNVPPVRKDKSVNEARRRAGREVGEKSLRIPD